MPETNDETMVEGQKQPARKDAPTTRAHSAAAARVSNPPLPDEAADPFSLAKNDSEEKQDDPLVDTDDDMSILGNQTKPKKKNQIPVETVNSNDESEEEEEIVDLQAKKTANPTKPNTAAATSQNMEEDSDDGSAVDSSDGEEEEETESGDETAKLLGMTKYTNSTKKAAQESAKKRAKVSLRWHYTEPTNMGTFPGAEHEENYCIAIYITAVHDDNGNPKTNHVLASFSYQIRNEKLSIHKTFGITPQDMVRQVDQDHGGNGWTSSPGSGGKSGGENDFEN